MIEFEPDVNRHDEERWQQHLERWGTDYRQRYGDLCTICRMDLAMENDDVCKSCAEELEPEARS